MRLDHLLPFNAAVTFISLFGFVREKEGCGLEGSRLVVVLEKQCCHPRQLGLGLLPTAARAWVFTGGD